MKTTMKRIFSLLIVLVMVCGMLPVVASAADGTTYTFSSYTAGTQYAKNEEHVLDSDVTVVTTQCHFTTELRIYSSNEHNGYAIIKCTNAGKSFAGLTVNAGNKTDKLNLYGSNDDGATWTSIGSVSTSSSYKDLAYEFGGNTYTSLKMDVAGDKQVRVKKMTVTLAGGCSHNYTEEITKAATCTEDGVKTSTCSLCGDSYTQAIPATGHTWDGATCSTCGKTVNLYVLVDDVNDLAAGDEIIIVSADKAYALGTTQNSNNRNAVSISATAEGYIALEDGFQAITLKAGATSGTFALNVGNGYLRAVSGNNYLRTQDAIDANSSWTITIANGEATIIIGNYQIMKNSSSALFSCYKGTQKAVAIYKLPASAGACTHEYTEEITTAATCTTAGEKTLTCSLCGDTKTEVIPATGHDFTNGDCACGEADPIKSIPDANTLGAACEHDNFTSEKYTVVGTVKEIANAEYGNMYIEDAEGNTLFIYGLYSADGKTRFDAMEVKPAVGDQIKVYGVLGNYNGAQMKNAWLLKIADYVDSYNVVLTDKIGMNFKLSADVTSATVTFNGETTTVDLTSLPIDKNGLRIYSLKMAAAQMTEEVTWLFNDKVEATYSVRGYADVVLNGKYGVNEKAMVRAMLHYGAAAQDYFNYNEGNFANADMTDTVTNRIQAAEMVPTTGETAGIVHYGSTLVYRDRVAVRVYFMLTGDAAIGDYTFTANGEAVEAQEGSNGLYYVEIADIAPQNLDDAVTVTVNDGLTVTYSALNYITRMVNKTEDNALKTLLQQLYDYYMAAEYLDEHGPNDFETEPDVVG